MGKVRHYKRWHHHFSELAASIAVLSFLVAMTGILDFPNTATLSGPMISAQATLSGAESSSMILSYPESTDFGSLRTVLSSDPPAGKDSDPGDQSVPAHTAHCPMNLGLTVVCPDVLSSAVPATLVPEPADSIHSLEAPRQPARALSESLVTSFYPVSLTRLSISRV